VAIGNADKEHIHHRLMDIGHSHRQAVLLMYLWSALISGAALSVAMINGRTTVGIILVSTMVVLAATSLPRLRRTNGRAAAPAPPPEPERTGAPPARTDPKLP
jgi:UDP-GlcNAc:undecaprenyl-phosphate GlcNAc-1-phosphate transferase